MSKIEKFEDIVAWKKGRELTLKLYHITGSSSFKKDFGLVDQMRRASVSIISNIAEGFERSSDKDFARFLYMAKGSAAEVRSQIYVALDLAYITQNELTPYTKALKK